MEERRKVEGSWKGRKEEVKVGKESRKEGGMSEGEVRQVWRKKGGRLA